MCHHATIPTCLLAAAFMGIHRAPVHAQSFNEGFISVALLDSSGWLKKNKSEPPGITGWSQGDFNSFVAQAGPYGSFVSANYLNTSGSGTISNWLMTPVRTLADGDVVSFYTRTVSGSTYAERLEVRMSLSGASDHVGDGAMDVGDFSTLLLTINPNLLPTGYPQFWMQYSVTLSGIPNPTPGRLAFRYFVTDGGPSGFNSNYIGIDTFSYTSTTISSTGVEHDVPQVGIHPNPTRDQVRLKAPWIGDEPMELSIHDSRGRRMLERIIPAGAGSEVVTDVSMLTAGSYVVELRTASHVARGRLIVQ